MNDETPQHHQSITHGLDTGQVGEIGNAWYTFLRAVLNAERTIKLRRAARQETVPDISRDDAEQAYQAAA